MARLLRRSITVVRWALRNHLVVVRCDQVTRGDRTKLARSSATTMISFDLERCVACYTGCYDLAGSSGSSLSTLHSPLTDEHCCDCCAVCSQPHSTLHSSACSTTSHGRRTKPVLDSSHLLVVSIHCSQPRPSSQQQQQQQ